MSGRGRRGPDRGAAVRIGSGDAGFAGLLSLILAVVIIGVLATMAVSSTWFADPISPGPAGVVELGPTGVVDPGPVLGGPSNVAVARSAACRANVRAVEEAMARKQAVDGTPASSIEQLMAEGWLSSSFTSSVDRLTIEATDGDPNPRLVVNGSAGADGCPPA